ncbi:MAG: hypothetical protein ACXWHZ_16830, partial [Usitatibacter sp.]
MTKMLCPHCSRPVKANPLGRWYAKFICPHCRGALKFDAATNAIGVAGSLLFFVMAFALVMGSGESARLLAAASGALWIVSL